MLDFFDTASPQFANYQEFWTAGTAQNWIKPRGVSMVRFLLISAGGLGANGTSTAGGVGGGSGAIVSWLGPAIFVPDVLRIYVARSGFAEPTTVTYQQKNSAGFVLLSVASANGQFGGVFNNSQFMSCGIFQAVSGVNGSAEGTNVLASSITFLSAGAGGSGSAAVSGGRVACNYNYPTTPANSSSQRVGENGFFITQPFLLGRGGQGGGTNETQGGNGGRGGVGCGGGGAGEDALSGRGSGGNGAAFIWAW